MLKLNAPLKSVPIETVKHAFLDEHQIQLDMLREDLRHPTISGNKWHKLRYHLDAAQQMGKKQILSFGGAYSNHLHALAYTCQQQGLQSIGIIRGGEKMTPTLQDIKHWGMVLEPISRIEYRQRNNHEWLAMLQKRYSDAYIIPEGGGGELGLRGCIEWGQSLQPIASSYDALIIAVGTGVTATGLALGSKAKQVEAFLMHKDIEVENRCAELIGQEISNLNWITGYDCGGFAKQPPILREFVHNWNDQQTIKLEPVYTGKLMYALFQRIQKGAYNKGSRLLFIHTGGMQGAR